MKWSFEKIGNLCRIKHGFAFKGEFFTDSGEFILLTPGNFNETGGLKLKGDKEKYYRGEIPADFILEEGDLLIVLTDLMQNAPILGGAAFIPVSNRFLHNQRLGKVEHLNLSRIDAKFFFYCLNDESYRGQVRSSATGSTVRHSAPERVYNCQIPLPPLPTQQKIAAILSAYDDLIENNLRRIRLLEEAAQHLYREWFVRFRFPGWEEVKVVDGLPEGWERKKIGEVCEAVGGGTPSTKEPKYWDGGEIIWFSPTDLSKNSSLVLLDSTSKITEEGLKNSSAKLLPPRTILMSSRATIGLFGIISKHCSTNQGFISIIPNEEHFRFYLLFNLLHRKQEIINNANGSTFKEITKKNFREMEILMPSDELAKRFYGSTEAFLNQIENLEMQNQKLKEARDILLPRLMNQTIEI